MIDIRIIKGALAQKPVLFALLPPFTAIYALMGIWHVGIAQMAYWGPFLIGAMPFGGSRNGLGVINCLPTERSRLVNSVWALQVFVLPALASGIALFFTALLLIWFHDSPETVLGRWFFYSGLNMVLSGAGSAYLALFTRAKVMRHLKGEGAYTINLVLASFALLFVFILFMRAPFSFGELGESGSLACAGACMFMAVSFVVRDYLVVDARTLAVTRKQQVDGGVLALRNVGGKLGFIVNLMLIAVATYLVSISVPLFILHVLPLLSGEVYRADRPGSLVGLFLFFTCIGPAWFLMLRARMMARTLRMLPLTPTWIVALMTGRYCAMVLGVTAGLATLQSAGAFQPGYLAYVMLLGLLGVILLVAAFSLLSLHPQYVMVAMVIVLNFFIITSTIWSGGSNYAGLVAFASAVLVLAGLGLHYYAVTHSHVMYRIPIIGGDQRFQ